MTNFTISFFSLQDNLPVLTGTGSLSLDDSTMNYTMTLNPVLIVGKFTSVTFQGTYVNPNVKGNGILSLNPVSSDDGQSNLVECIVVKATLNNSVADCGSLNFSNMGNDYSGLLLAVQSNS